MDPLEQFLVQFAGEKRVTLAGFFSFFARLAATFPSSLTITPCQGKNRRRSEDKI
jgi:hypothetical protein